MRRLRSAASMLVFASISLACPVSAQEAPEAGGDATPPLAEAAPAEPMIDILNYRIEGNSALDRKSVEKAVMPFLGPKRSTKDVELARTALQKAYQDAGYATVSVDIPQQDVRNGIVHLNVVEMKVGRLRVKNAHWYSPEDIKARTPALTEGNVPNYNDVSKQIAALNKSAERSITPTLRAGDTPGTVDVDLEVEDRLPLHGTLEVNDRSSARTERLRVSASVRYANLFQSEHSLSLQGQFAPEDPGQSWALSGSYVAPIIGSPFTVVLYGFHSNSDVSALGDIQVLGSGDIIGVRGIYSFNSGDTAFHTLTFGADYKNFKEGLRLADNQANTPIDYIPLTLQYAFAKRGERSDFDANLALNFGLRGLDATESEFNLKRFNASASWAYLRGDISYQYRLPSDIRLGLKLSGQLSGQPLISNEQFSLGGYESVRGYYESQELGDDGASFQFDIASPSLLGSGKDGLPADNELRLFAFFDGGVTRIYDPLPDDKGRYINSATLLSVGGGINARILRRINATGLIALPLRNRAATLTDFGGDVRGQFRVWTEF